MLEKFPEAYASLIAIDTKWINYTQAVIQGTIYRISCFLKTDIFKVLHIALVLCLSCSDKCLRLATEIVVCRHPICGFKVLRHAIENCLEFYPKRQLVYQWIKAEQAELKIKGIT